ncbi:amino acid adenylation domain-containing protein [Roseibium sp. RKSG952]|uniref:non-ribosomal peptide synthetase n=1 Tax=Roseibium sp. RKSG952 TaxID=2529384 RepID=UPI001FCA8D21|nr:amino acid adenylation domain-containing protein [Roseibium sp. RKSG952]
MPDSEGEVVQAGYIAPVTPTAVLLCDIIAEVVQVERVGLSDNFFDIGGDSMKALRVIGRLSHAGVSVSVKDFYQAPVLGDLATSLEGGGVSGDAEYIAANSSPFGLVDRQLVGQLPANVVDAYPLTRLQEGMLFHSRKDDDGSAYHDVFNYVVGLPFDQTAMEGALEYLTRRHDVLRTAFDTVNFGEPIQLVYADATLPLTVIAGGKGCAPLEDIVREFINEERKTQFDWLKPPLARVFVHVQDDEAFALTFSFLHAILDGWSVAALITELVDLYQCLLEGRVSCIGGTEVACKFRDFVALERLAIESEEDGSWWREHLGGAECVKLPDVSVYRAGSASEPNDFGGVEDHSVVLSEGMARSLKQFAANVGVPLRTIFLTAYLKVLSRYTGTEDVVTGLVCNGRPEVAGGDQVLGLFLNTVPMRVILQPGQTWKELVKLVFDVERGVMAHRRSPLFDIQRQLGKTEFFQSVFNYIDFHVFENAVDHLGKQVVQGGYGAFEKSNFSLTANVGRDARTNRLGFVLTYQADELSGDLIRSMAREFFLVLKELLSASDEKHSDQKGLSDLGSEKLLQRFNDTASGLLPGETIVDLFQEKALTNPDAIAVIDGESHTTYGEIEAASNCLARYLISVGVGEEDVVGVCIGRSAELIVSLLAIVKVGGVYMPLDPAYPTERIGFMIKDASAQLVLTTSEYCSAIALLEEYDIRWIELDEPEFRKNLGQQSVNSITGKECSSRPSSSSAAYLIYTSGSTGRPKGVVVDHGNSVSFAGGLGTLCSQEEIGKVGWFSSVGFDASVWDILMSFRLSGTLIVVPEAVRTDGHKLAGFMNSSRIEALFLPPLLLPDLVQNDLSSLRMLITGGEKPDNIAAGIAASRYRYINAYGPTETTVVVTTYSVQAPRSEHPIPIGSPMADTQVYVVDRHLNLVPVGVAGELLIGGGQVSRGYRNRPGLTAEKFIANPFTDKPGSRLYRTGDRARRRPDGALEFLGRIDTQIKIRGMRVELEEIEAVLAEQAGILQAAVVARDVHDGTPEQKQLIAYVVPDVVDDQVLAAALGIEENQINEEDHASVLVLDSASSVDLIDIRAGLAKNLPAHMIPARFVVLSRFPVSPSGKVDRKALPDVFGQRIQAPFAELTTETEKAIAEIFKEIFGEQNIGCHDSFFDLGGHSLMVMQLITRIETVLGKSVTIRDVFEAPTVHGLAERVEVGAKRYSPLVRFVQDKVISESSPRTIVCFHPGGGLASVYGQKSVLSEWGAFGAVIGVQARGLEHGEEPFESYEEMVTCYASAIQEELEGPFVFIGWSLGGHLAQELAARLQCRGERIDGLVILDAIASRKSLDEDRIVSKWTESERINRLLRIFEDTPVPILDNLTTEQKVARLGNHFQAHGLLPEGSDVSSSDMTNHILRMMNEQGALLPSTADKSPFDGPTLLVRARDTSRIQEDAFFGWSHYCNDLETIDLNSDHLQLLMGKMTVLTAKAVAAWIKKRFCEYSTG